MSQFLTDCIFKDDKFNLRSRLFLGDVLDMNFSTLIVCLSNEFYKNFRYLIMQYFVNTYPGTTTYVNSQLL